MSRNVKITWIVSTVFVVLGSLTPGPALYFLSIIGGVLNGLVVCPSLEKQFFPAADNTEGEVMGAFVASLFFSMTPAFVAVFMVHSVKLILT